MDYGKSIVDIKSYTYFRDKKQPAPQTYLAWEKNKVAIGSNKDKVFPIRWNMKLIKVSLLSACREYKKSPYWLLTHVHMYMYQSGNSTSLVSTVTTEFEHILENSPKKACMLIG